MVDKKIGEKIKELLPSMDELADVMAPTYAGEALAPLSERISTNFIDKQPDMGPVKTGNTLTKVKKILPSLDELADVMTPTYAGEALAPLSERISVNFTDKQPDIQPARVDGVGEKVKELLPSMDELADVMAPTYAGEALAPTTDSPALNLDVKIEPINRIFADVMRAMCNIGLVVIFLFGALYFTGLYPGDNLNLEVMKWNEPATMFWKDVKGVTVNGYSWFLMSFTDPESDVIIGTSILALTPLVGALFMIPQSKGVLRILLIVITIEFVYAILRPLIMSVGGVG